MNKRGQDGMLDDGSSSVESALDRNVSLLADWLKDMPIAQLHPLMQQPMAAMAAATAVGIGLSGQFAGLMLGAMQGLNGGMPKQTPLQAEPEPVMKTAPQQATVVETPAPVKAVKAVRTSKAGAATRQQPKGEAEQTPRPVRGKKAAEPDDLKQISGIGPKLEQVLNRMGVATYSDIAAWNEADVTRIDEQLGFSGRIVRDGWIEQAKALSKGRKG